MLRDHVKKRAGMDPFAVDATNRLRVTVTRKGILYQGHLEVSNDEGKVVWAEDTKPSDVCDLVVIDAILIVSDNLRPSSPPSKPSPSPSVSSTAPSAAPVSPNGPDSDERDGWKHVHLQGGAMALAGVGALPRVAFGPGINIGIRFEYLAVLLEGRVLLTPEFPIPSGPISAQLYMGLVKTCVNNLPLGFARFLEVCVGAGSGSMTMGTPGWDDRILGMETSHPFTVTANFSAGAEYDPRWFPGLHIRALAEFGAPIVGTKVSYDAGAHWEFFPKFHGIFGFGFSMYSKYDAPRE